MKITKPHGIHTLRHFISFLHLHLWSYFCLDKLYHSQTYPEHIKCQNLCQNVLKSKHDNNSWNSSSYFQIVILTLLMNILYCTSHRPTDRYINGFKTLKQRYNLVHHVLCVLKMAKLFRKLGIDVPVWKVTEDKRTNKIRFSIMFLHNIWQRNIHHLTIDCTSWRRMVISLANIMQTLRKLYV